MPIRISMERGGPRIRLASKSESFRKRRGQAVEGKRIAHLDYFFFLAGNVPLSAVFPFSSRRVISLVSPLRSGMFFSQSE